MTLLYHGTNGALLPAILEEGIRPRGPSGQSNWTHSVESNPNCVYLTDSYAPYFAMNAQRGSCAVIEVDTARLGEEDLYPDEDFLEQIGRHRDGVPGDMKARTRHYRLRQFSYDWPCRSPEGGLTTWWKASLRYLGTCSHRGPIPAGAITRVVTWPHQRGLMFFWDPSICLMNQKVMGDIYRALTAQLFAGEFVSPEEWRDMPPLERFTNPKLPVIEGWERIDR